MKRTDMPKGPKIPATAGEFKLAYCHMLHDLKSGDPWNAAGRSADGYSHWFRKRFGVSPEEADALASQLLAVMCSDD